MPRIHVIGIGYRPFDREAHELVLSATVVLASPRLMEVFPDYAEYSAVREKVLVLPTVDETIAYMQRLLEDDAHAAIVLLASGDPLFFGIGRKCLNVFGAAEVGIIPDLSSMQLAFSRIREPWDNALFISLHGGPDPKRRRELEYPLREIPSLALTTPSLLILTDRVNTPAAIARAFTERLLTREREGITFFICEKLGYSDERVITGNADEIAGQAFADPNLVIVRNKAARIPATGAGPLGIGEGELAHERGLITKDEVRAVSLHALRLPARGVFWDIGAGSGSVSIEAARLCPGLRVFSVERHEEQIAFIRRNAESFGVPNVMAVPGSAPDMLADLPAPDRVFIGGSGGRMKDIIGHVLSRMEAGIVVVNAATFETLDEALGAFRAAGLEPDVSQISVSRMKPVGTRHLFAAQNPIFVVRARKG